MAKTLTVKTNQKLFNKYNARPSIKIKKVPNGTRMVVLSDLQIPYQDDALLKVIEEQFIPWFKPKGAADYDLFINGDLVDLYSISRFSKNPTANFNLADEISSTSSHLRRLGKRFTGKHYVFGNHEERFEKYVWEQAPDVAEFVPPLEEVLHLDQLGYDWVPYGKHYDYLGFIITHGNTSVQYSAAKELGIYHRSGTSGHTNRPQAVMTASAAGEDPITWYSTGMLCRTDIGDMIPAFRRTMPWQQCFGIGEVVDGVLHYELVRVHHGSFRAAGKVFSV
jgi:hypothetical protein